MPLPQPLGQGFLWDSDLIHAVLAGQNLQGCPKVSLSSTPAGNPGYCWSRKDLRSYLAAAGLPAILGSGALVCRHLSVVVEAPDTLVQGIYHKKE